MEARIEFDAERKAAWYGPRREWRDPDGADAGYHEVSFLRSGEEGTGDDVWSVYYRGCRVEGAFVRDVTDEAALEEDCFHWSVSLDGSEDWSAERPVVCVPGLEDALMWIVRELTGRGETIPARRVKVKVGPRDPYWYRGREYPAA